MEVANFCAAMNSLLDQDGGSRVEGVCTKDQFLGHTVSFKPQVVKIMNSSLTLKVLNF